MHRIVWRQGWMLHVAFLNLAENRRTDFHVHHVVNVLAGKY